MEIWCGCSLGNLRVIDVRTAQLSVHLSHHLSSGASGVHILCASKNSAYQYSIWTAMKTGINRYTFIYGNKMILFRKFRLCLESSLSSNDSSN